MFRHGYDLRELTVAACRAEGFEPEFAVEGGEMDAVLGFVRAGLGVAVVPRMVAERAGPGPADDAAGQAGPAPHDRARPPQRRGAAAGGAGTPADAGGALTRPGRLRPQRSSAARPLRRSSAFITG